MFEHRQIINANLLVRLAGKTQIVVKNTFCILQLHLTMLYIQTDTSVFVTFLLLIRIRFFYPNFPTS